MPCATRRAPGPGGPRGATSRATRRPGPRSRRRCRARRRRRGPESGAPRAAVSRRGRRAPARPRPPRRASAAAAGRARRARRRRSARRSHATGWERPRGAGARTPASTRPPLRASRRSAPGDLRASPWAYRMKSGSTCSTASARPRSRPPTTAAAGSGPARPARVTIEKGARPGRLRRRRAGTRPPRGRRKRVTPRSLGGPQEASHRLEHRHLGQRAGRQHRGASGRHPAQQHLDERASRGPPERVAVWAGPVLGDELGVGANHRGRWRAGCWRARPPVDGGQVGGRRPSLASTSR